MTTVRPLPRRRPAQASAAERSVRRGDWDHSASLRTVIGLPLWEDGVAGSAGSSRLTGCTGPAPTVFDVRECSTAFSRGGEQRNSDMGAWGRRDVLARGRDVHGSASTVLDQIRTVITGVGAVVTRSHLSRPFSSGGSI